MRRPEKYSDANFSLKLSWRTYFAKIKIKKKLLPKINVKNIENRVKWLYVLEGRYGSIGYFLYYVQYLF